MAEMQVKTGYSKNNLPYVYIGSGEHALVIFDGLDFNHKPPSGMMLRMSIGNFKRIAEEYRICIVSRKPNLPIGYSLRDLSEDYATMIRNEIGAPTNVMGISTGGTIAQHFAANHPELIHRLVISMTGYCLKE